MISIELVGVDRSLATGIWYRFVVLTKLCKIISECKFMLCDPIYKLVHFVTIIAGRFMGSEAGGYVVSIRIAERLNKAPPISSDFCIFKVHDRLKNVNRKAYEPQMLAIGPYHHGKDHLQQMEDHKLHYLRLLLQRRKEQYSDLQRYASAMKGLEERTRKCYAESVPLDSDEFVEMMVLDSCFLVELVRRCCAMTEFLDNDDPIFFVPTNFNGIVRDVLLLENQLPMFVVSKFFELTRMVDESRDEFIPMVTHFFKWKPMGLGFIDINDEGCLSEHKHILSLVHDNWIHQQGRRNIPAVRNRTQFKRIVCATKLREAGIKLRHAIEGHRNTLLDVKFEHGTLFIPTMAVEDDTESFLRNMISYEQLRPMNQPSYVMYYMTLMDCLIDTRADVELLCRCGIISHQIGDDEKVATLFRKLGDHVDVHCSYFTYSEVFEQVNEHCGKKRHRWMAKLRHDYFTSPWAVLSFLAAFVLLLLAFVQALYSGLSYYK